MLALYDKKEQFLLHMFIVLTKKTTFPEKMKPLIWNKVHVSLKNTWKLIKLPAHLFQVLE